MVRIDLLTFVDFVLSSGVDKIRRAEPPCSPERMVLILAGAKLAGFTPGVIDTFPRREGRLVRESPNAPSASDVALLFKVEAAAFCLFRRHAEARAT